MRIAVSLVVRTEPSEPRDVKSVTYTHSDVMVTWREVSDRRGDVTDIVYVIDFRSADDDVTSCGQWSVNGSVKVTQQLVTADDRLTSVVNGLCPATKFSFTVISFLFRRDLEISRTYLTVSIFIVACYISKSHSKKVYNMITASRHYSGDT